MWIGHRPSLTKEMRENVWSDFQKPRENTARSREVVFYIKRLSGESALNVSSWKSSNL
jgi:hypothetical protein